MRTMLVAALLLCSACYHNPNAPKSNAPLPICDVHAHRAGDFCDCDPGYTGDGTTCKSNDDDHPICDINATWNGVSCACNAGFHGTGMICTAD